MKWRLVMNFCECKHWNYCKIEDKGKCKLQGDPWVKPDSKIFGLDSIEINKMQGRDGDLKHK